MKNMAHLQTIILLLITTSVNCCDETDCRVGVSVAGAAGTAVGALGALSCAFTLGIGCVVAMAGTIVAGNAAAGANLCAKCRSEPAISREASEKFDKILKQQKENFQKLNKAQIKNHLENLGWFKTLSSTQKELLSGQAVLKVRQERILKDLTTVILKTQQITKSIDKSQIISLYGDSISNLLHIQSLFSDLHTDEFGGIIHDLQSDEFVDATNHIRYGSKRNTKDVIKMLTYGHPLKRENIWEVDAYYCSKTSEEFFSSLLYTSFVFRRIALQMEGKSMSKREAERFENDLKKVKRSFDKHCLCTGAVNGQSTTRCDRIYHYAIPNVPSTGFTFYKVRTFGVMSAHNIAETCSSIGMLTPCQSIPDFKEDPSINCEKIHFDNPKRSPMTQLVDKVPSCKNGNKIEITTQCKLLYVWTINGYEAITFKGPRDDIDGRTPKYDEWSLCMIRN